GAIVDQEEGAPSTEVARGDGGVKELPGAGLLQAELDHGRAPADEGLDQVDPVGDGIDAAGEHGLYDSPALWYKPAPRWRRSCKWLTRRKKSRRAISIAEWSSATSRRAFSMRRSTSGT